MSFFKDVKKLVDEESEDKPEAKEKDFNDLCDLSEKLPLNKNIMILPMEWYDTFRTGKVFVHNAENNVIVLRGEVVSAMLKDVDTPHGHVEFILFTKFVGKPIIAVEV